MIALAASGLMQIIVAQVFLGVLNNLSEIMPTIIGELSDASNRSSAFAYLPIFNWLGAVIGPLIGGYLSKVEGETADSIRFPFVPHGKFSDLEIPCAEFGQRCSHCSRIHYRACFSERVAQTKSAKFEHPRTRIGTVSPIGRGRAVRGQ